MVETDGAAIVRRLSLATFARQTRLRRLPSPGVVVDQIKCCHVDRRPVIVLCVELERLVRSLRLGSDVAEQDSQLSRYFVKNSAYYQIIDDEVDVILGPKGTGKSAISRLLVDVSTAGLPADVDAIPAFNLQGSSIFRRLSTEAAGVDEGTMRTAWSIYILALIGNHLVDNYWNGHVEDLSKRLARLKLRFDDDRPKSAWSRVMAAIKNLKPSKFEASLTVSDSGMPFGTAQLDFADSDEKPSPIDWEALLKLEIGVLDSLGRRCWLVFDRLDEAFPHDRELERTALRALLQTHRDVCSYGDALKTKLFLRTDLLDRITEGEGFVNASHLRWHQITWDSESIIDFVARRILGSPELSSFFNVDEDYLRTSEGRREAFNLILPSDMWEPDNTGTSVRWLIAYTSDASEEPNPRNILTLLREARTKQLQICAREAPDYTDNSALLSRYAATSGYRALSRIRVQDTLYAEYSEYRAWFKAMEGRPSTYTPEQFASTMGVDDQRDLDVVIDALRYFGVFRQAPSGRLTVPVLYRNGMKLQDRPETVEARRRRQQRRHS